jgi:hypothetical protein
MGGVRARPLFRGGVVAADLAVAAEEGIAGTTNAARARTAVETAIILRTIRILPWRRRRAGHIE